MSNGAASKPRHSGDPFGWKAFTKKVPRVVQSAASRNCGHRHDNRSRVISRRIIRITRALTSAGRSTTEPNRSHPALPASGCRHSPGRRRSLMLDRLLRQSSNGSGGRPEGSTRAGSIGGVARGFDDGRVSRYTESPPEVRGDARTSCEVPAGLVFRRPFRATKPYGPSAPPDVAPEFEPTLARPPRVIHPRSAAGWQL